MAYRIAYQVAYLTSKICKNKSVTYLLFFYFLLWSIINSKHPDRSLTV